MANQKHRGHPARSNPPPPPSPPPPPPPPPPTAAASTQGQQLGGDEDILQETGMAPTKNPRANWNHQMKLFLIGLMKDHDLPRYRTQNAWSKEAWTSIVAQFNQKFSLSYTMAQVKQKEQDLKKEYRVVKDLSAESGFGWDPNRNMVVAPDSVWRTLGTRRNRDALLPWREKSFPYFDDLFALHDGRYAQGRSCHGMDHYAYKAKVSAEGPSSPALPVHDVPLNSPSPTIHASAQVNESMLHASSEGAYAPHCSNQDTLGPGQLHDSLRRNSEPSNSTPEVSDGKRPKKQKTRTTITTGDFQERYLMLKKEGINRFAAIEDQKMNPANREVSLFFHGWATAGMVA
ncbi:hypothetical protein ACP4OV_012898 [Aristida adscensionis]